MPVWVVKSFAVEAAVMLADYCDRACVWDGLLRQPSFPSEAACKYTVTV